MVIAGNGPEYRNYKKLIRELKLEKRVKLIGRISDEERANYFYGCEFFVLPSRSEAFGLTNLEAMITGKAVVATAVEGVPELVKNGWNGILVKPNSESICNGMSYLLKNKRKMKSLGKNGRKFARRLTWDKSTEGYLKVYKKLSRSG